MPAPFGIKRGDVIAWPVEHVTTHANTFATSVTTSWHIGIVTSVSPTGQTLTVDTGTSPRRKLRHDNGQMGVRGNRIDLAKARKWLKDHGTAPLASADEVRDVVRTWLTP